MKWFRGWLKQIVIRWVIEDYRSNGQIRRAIKADEITLDVFIEPGHRKTPPFEDPANRGRYV